MSSTDVIIVGAGPYGLSMSAHLSAHAIDHRIFGTPMAFWAETMPPNMALKTSWATAGFSDPRKPYSLIDYCRERGLPHDESGPIRLETFVAYGREFQRRSVPGLIPTHITRIARAGDRFRVTTADGATIEARKVVVATGIGEHRFVPDEVAALPDGVLYHSATCGNFEKFKDKDVVVIGGGASAIDTAAALRQFGGRGIVVARRDAVRYQSPGTARSLWQRIRTPDSKLGPGWRALAVTTLPLAFHALPSKFREDVVRRFLGPAASWPARQLVEGHVPFRLGATIAATRMANGKAEVDLVYKNGTTETLVADNVIAATGYRVEIKRYDLLDKEIRNAMAIEDGSPALSRAFETSIPGLYFTGTASAIAFGPMFRFVMGCPYTARRITDHLARQLQRRPTLDSAPVPATAALSGKQA
jgi:thioredoxin reductase